MTFTRFARLFSTSLRFEIRGVVVVLLVILRRIQSERRHVLVHAVRPLGTLALVLGKPSLRPVESRLVDKDGHSVLDHDVAVVILADVGAVLEHLVQHVHAELRVPRRAQALRVHLLGNGLQRFARCVFPERPLHERRCVRVRDVLLRGPVHTS